MTRPAATATTREKTIYADQQCGYWLAEANEASERGDHAKAEKLYEKSQYWLDRLNQLEGNN